MTARISARKAYQTLPACLLENPYKLVTLWDIVIQFALEKWFWSGWMLESVGTDCLMGTGLGSVTMPAAALYQPISEKVREDLQPKLWKVHEECMRLGLVVSGRTIEDVIRKIEDPSSHWSWLSTQIAALRDLIQREMQGRSFWYIPAEKIQYWPTTDRPHAFSDSVAQAFPSVSFDVTEAAICLALARSTSCVFHLMRVLEISLCALGRVFGLTLNHTNWAPAIEQIESKIRDMHKDPNWKVRPDCKDQQEFFSQAISFLAVTKDAWRNYTAHSRGKYTESEAALMFDNVRSFMQRLATQPDLHEVL